MMFYICRVFLNHSLYGVLNFANIGYPVGIYKVSSSDRTPKDTAHKQITEQNTNILDVVKTLKEGNNPRPEPTQPL